MTSIAAPPIWREKPSSPGVPFNLSNSVSLMSSFAINGTARALASGRARVVFPTPGQPETRMRFLGKDHAPDGQSDNEA